jgi:hypothetical protein
MNDGLLYEDSPRSEGGYCSVCRARTLEGDLCSYHGGRTANEIMSMPSDAFLAKVGEKMRWGYPAPREPLKMGSCPKCGTTPSIIAGKCPKCRQYPAGTP